MSILDRFLGKPTAAVAAEVEAELNELRARLQAAAAEFEAGLAAKDAEIAKLKALMDTAANAASGRAKELTALRAALAAASAPEDPAQLTGWIKEQASRAAQELTARLGLQPPVAAQTAAAPSAIEVYDAMKPGPERHAYRLAHWEELHRALTARN